MREPRRLDEGDATPFERQLLEAARRRAPGPALKARMAERLGLIEGMPISGPGASAPMGWLPSAVLVLASIGMVVALPMALRARHYRTAFLPTQTRPVLDRSPLVPPATEVAAPEVGTPPVGSTLLSPSSKSPESIDWPTTVSDGSLKGEIRLLDRARTAMVAGRPHAALAELGRYGQRFPQGAFRPEAMVLRIEALDATGDSHDARTLGRQFLAQHPESPLSDRVAAIVQR